MGLLDQDDWKAQWIGNDKLRQVKPGKLVLPPAVLLRHAFKADKPVRRAVVYATALGLFDLHLNGKRISDDYFNPGWTDYRKRVYYRATMSPTRYALVITFSEQSWPTGGAAVISASRTVAISMARIRASWLRFTSNTPTALLPSLPPVRNGRRRLDRSVRPTCTWAKPTTLS